MPRYFFNLRYGREIIRDDHGDELPDDQVALERALDTAKELLRGGADTAESWNHCVFEVTNDNGEAVWRMPVLDAVTVASE